MLRALDLFCGAGGMSLGLQRAGFDIVAGLDNWPEAVSTYSKNFDHAAIQADLGSTSAEQIASSIDVRPGELDLVAGGPPCQGFSIQRIGTDIDIRNDLVGHFGRLVVGLMPRAFLMENVPGLLGKRGTLSFNGFGTQITAAGYEFEVHRVDAAEFSVPQRRPRVVVYGWRTENPPRFSLSRLPHTPVTVTDAFRGLPAPAPSGAQNVVDRLHIESKLSELNRLRLKHIPPGGGFEDLPMKLRVPAHRNGAAKIGHRAVYGRLHPDRPANVITARFDSFTRGRFAHPTDDRNITLREGARLQSFPDSFEFVGNREQMAALIGNSVPPLLAERVGSLIATHLQPARDEALQAPIAAPP